MDGCTYDIRAVATDPNTGLRSPEASSTFTVEFAHVAAQPSATVTVDQQRKYAFVSVSAPAGALEGDTCEVYRMTTDGAQFITSTAFGSTVRDRFAPYASMRSDAALAYRIATVTKDGDRAWLDVPYVLYGDGLRLDWEDRHVELPYNLSLGEGYAKASRPAPTWTARRMATGTRAARTTRRCPPTSYASRAASSASSCARWRDIPARSSCAAARATPLTPTWTSTRFLSHTTAGRWPCRSRRPPIALTQAHMCGAGDGVVTTLPKEEANA